jgi:predicted transcriptional regulator
MFNNKKMKELEEDIKHLHEVCTSLTKMIDNLQSCLKDQLEINAMVRERLKILEGEEDGRQTISQLHQ